jgi:hypothetical protein
MASGWHPLRVLLSVKSDPETFSNASTLIDNGVFEIAKCSEKSTECLFIFRDEFSNLLAVTTANNFEHSFHGANVLCTSDQKEWDGRASKITKVILSLNAEYISKKIQSLAHPTGNTPVLGNISIAKYDDQISAEIEVSWHGGFSNTAYKTTVAWRLNKSDHISTTIKSDTANFGVAPENLANLNTFFATDVFPLIKQALTE